MRVLLDTVVFLWWLADDPRLGVAARRVIEDPAKEVYVSAASGWEIAIKRASGKLIAPGDIHEWLDQGLFDHLPIELDHAIAAGALPPHHRDPFDRLLVAQAQTEDMALLTSDDVMGRYDVDLIDART